MNENNAKQVNDLRGYYPWMIRRARARVSDAYAEDVANAALCDAHAPERERPVATDVSRVKGWLDTLIDFRAKAHWKEESKHADVILCENIEEEVADAQDIDIEAQFELRDWVRRGLESLPEDRRDLLLACSVEKTPIEEMVPVLGVDQNAIYARHHKAKNDLREKLLQLANVSFRRIRMLWPLLFLRWCWRRMVVATPDVDACSARTDRLAMAGAPARFVLGVAFGIAVLGFTPSSHWAASDKRIEMVMNSAHRANTVILPAVYSDVIAETGIPRAPKGHEAMVRFARPPPTKRSALASKHASKTEADTNDEEFVRLARAKAAYNKGDYAGSLALLDEDAAKRPNSPRSTVRESLRALAMKAMAAARR